MMIGTIASGYTVTSTAAPTVQTGTQSTAPAGFDTVIAVNKPTGTALGDRLVACISWVGSANPTLTGPAGWTQVAATTTNNTVASGSRCVGWTWTHTADSTDVAASTFTFTYSASGGTRRAACMRLTAASFDVAAVRMESISGGSGNYLCPTVTTTGTNRLLIYHITTQDGNNSVPSGTTSVVSWDGQFSKVTSETQAAAGLSTTRTTVSEGTEPIALETTAWYT